MRILRIVLVVLLTTAFATLILAQESSKIYQPKLSPQNSGTTELLIAVSPVNARVVWAAGTHGTFLLTTDGGKTWKSGVVKGAKSLQFRGVRGVSETVAYLQSIGTKPSDFPFTRPKTVAPLGRCSSRTRLWGRFTIASHSGRRSGEFHTAIR